LIEIVSNFIGNSMANLEVLRHFRSAKIKISKLKPKIFVHIFFVQRVGRCFGFVEDSESDGLEFHFPGCQFRIDGSFGTRNDFAFHGYDKLRSKGVAFGECFWIDDDLRESLSITEINEDEASMVTSGVYPTGQAYGLADVAFSQFRAMMGTVRIHLTKRKLEVRNEKSVRKDGTLRMSQ
jgi:hypothetical protein